MRRSHTGPKSSLTRWQPGSADKCGSSDYPSQLRRSPVPDNWPLFLRPSLGCSECGLSGAEHVILTLPRGATLTAPRSHSPTLPALHLATQTLHTFLDDHGEEVIGSSSKTHCIQVFSPAFERTLFAPPRAPSASLCAPPPPPGRGPHLRVPRRARGRPRRSARGRGRRCWQRRHRPAGRRPRPPRLCPLPRLHCGWPFHFLLAESLPLASTTSWVAVVAVQFVVKIVFASCLDF